MFDDVLNKLSLEKFRSWALVGAPAAPGRAKSLHLNSMFEGRIFKSVTI